MRVLVLTNMYPPHSFGGYELSCRDVVGQWREGGHDVRVLTGDVRLPDAGDGPEDPGVERRLRLYWRDHRMVDPSPLGRYRLEAANQAVLGEVLSRFRPDVVSAWAMGAMSMGLLTTCLAAGIPVVPVVCDEWPVYGPEADGWTRVMRHHRALSAVVGRLTGLPCALPPLDGAGTACFVSAALLAKVRAAAPWAFPGAVVVPSGIAAGEF
ncbi:MAG: glycosyltransferase, partial [Acidobacteriota bacterium]|nr:glycosyltransferase [Acidobacteriota bacterium]